jgi:hypothetical protein
MNHSLIGANRTTHLKIVSVALAGAIAVVLVGITARVAEGNGARVLSAGQPAVFTARDATTIR